MAAQENVKSGSISTIASETSSKKKDDNKNPFWHIDKEMLHLKLHFFLFIGALGTSLPYITIFAKNRVGISASSLAAILTTQQIMFIFTKPLIGYITDYFNKLKAVIYILGVIQTVFFCLLLIIPKIPKEQKTGKVNNETASEVLFQHLNSSQLQLKCESYHYAGLSSETTVVYFSNNDNSKLCFFLIDELAKFSDECSNYTSQRNELIHTNNNTLTIKSECKMCCKPSGDYYEIQCNTSKSDSIDSPSETKGISEFQTYQFWCYALLTTIAMGCTNALFTLSDTACCESVQKTGSDFGRQRLWGAIGWGLFAPIGGLLNDYTNDYVASWILMSVMSIVALMNIRNIDLLKPQFSQNLLKDVGSVLSSKDFLAFIAGVLMNGVGTGIIWFYLIWYLTTIGGSRFLCGMVQFVQCFVGEIPFMFFSGWAIQKIGHFNILTLALLSYCVRFFWYSYLQNPWLILPIECVHGFTYGLFYPAVASYAKLSAKPGTEATTQAVLFTAHEGLGPGIGCVIAGLGFDTIGGPQTFLYCSVFAGCGMVLSIILHLCVGRNKGTVNVTLPEKT